MSMNMVSVTVIGRLVADPVVREVNDKEVTNFRLITSKEINGEKKIIPFDCSAYNGLSKIAQYLSKGRLVCVTSNEFTQKIWTAEHGKTGIDNRLIINSLTMLDKKPEQEEECGF